MILVIKEDTISVPEHWNYSTKDGNWIFPFSRCRETCSGDMLSLARHNNYEPDIPVTIGEIIDSTKVYKLNKDQNMALKLLSYTLSELMAHQEYGFSEQEHIHFLSGLTSRWWRFNTYVGSMNLSVEPEINISMDKVVGDCSGAITGIPFNLTRYRALMSFLMAIPRAFMVLSRNTWMFVGHTEPKHHKTMYINKLWTNIYAGLGQAFSLYRYTGRYWWTFLHMLIQNTSEETSNGLLDLMDEYDSRNGVRRFIDILKRNGRLPEDSLYCYKNISERGFSYFSNVRAVQ